MTYGEFVTQRLSENDPEPFCPFESFGYCDVAYSDWCYVCKESEKEYTTKYGDDA